MQDKYPGLYAFFDVGNSTRTDQPNRVGRKGHGAKLALQSTAPLTLVTKVEGNSGVDADLWDVVEVKNPMQRLLNSKIPELQVWHLLSKLCSIQSRQLAK